MEVEAPPFPGSRFPREMIPALGFARLVNASSHPPFHPQILLPGRRGIDVFLLPSDTFLT